MSYFLGVDAGGTKTELVLGDELRELGRIRVGSIKRMRVSAEEAEANLRLALTQLEQLTGISARAIAHTCVGAAGSTVPLVTDWLQEAFSRLVGGSLTLLNDVEIAFDAVFQGGRGILVLAGTGSNYTARTRTGQILRAGGWGPALGDEGSGYWIGSVGLRSCFQAINRGRSSAMLQAALRHWHLESIPELVAYANRQPAPDFSRLAPLFVACAQQGDVEAQALLQEAGQLLARQTVCMVLRMQELEAPDPGPLPAVACIGSILAKARPVRTAFEHALRDRFPEIDILAEPADAAGGALWHARRATSGMSSHLLQQAS